MTNDKKKFTFEDWLDNGIDLRNTLNSIGLEAAKEKDLISASDKQKIKSAQLKAYDLSIKYSAKGLFNYFKWEFERCRDTHGESEAREFIDDKIQELKKRLAVLKVRDSVRKGFKDYHLVDGGRYKRIAQVDESQHFFSNKIKYTSSLPTTNLFTGWVLHEFIRRLEEFRNRLQESNKRKETDEVITKWKNKGLLSQEEKRDAVLDIASKKDLTHENAFELAKSSGINFGNMSKFGSWKRNNTRLNKS